ncbi:MAG: AAA family ATPase [Proteobacteria bacterium]|nr:AAA family ATPase [Pseudomonadota bacterium]
MNNPEEFLNAYGTREHFSRNGQYEQDAKSGRRRLQPYNWQELQNLPKREPLIKGVIDRRGLSVMVGDPNCGKTFNALDMALHIALGWSWRGRKTRQGKVLYVAAEGGLGIVERLQAFCLHHNLTEIPNFYLLPKSVNFFSNPEDAEEIINEIIILDGIELVVIDTLSQVLAGGNENSSEGAGTVLQNCKTIQQQTGAHIMIVHHTGKNGEYRGFSGILGNIDTMIKVTDNDGIIIAGFEKQRDGKKDDTFSSELKIIHLSTDDDGDAVTSCVLIQTDEPAAKNKSMLTGRAKDAFEILCNLIAEEGIGIIPKSGMAEVRGTKLKYFREALKEADIADGDKGDTQKKAIQRAIRKLKDAGKIKVWKDNVWITGQGDK